ncbi:MAG: glycine--tRNA ligase [Patescibacteria group bacterium]
MKKEENNLMEKIVSLCKRRGFVFPGSEIYGGMANSYDYGPLGAEVFNNIRNLWWKKFVHERDDMVGVRGPIIMNSKVWEASGHIKNFTDPLVECKICHTRLRSDKTMEIKEHEKSHKEKVEWADPKNFNLLFKTFIGATEDKTSEVYLRGETAQTMFTDFKLVMDSMRRKLPFGIAQIGRSFRNEITTGNFIFRMKEFTIAEFEYFVKPESDDKSFSELLDYQQDFFINSLGIKKENIKTVELSKDELAHYSKRTVDTYFNFPFGWDEVAGIANRVDYDLKNHIALSGENLSYKDEETKEEFVPYVIEPTFGLDRLLLAVLTDAYKEEANRVVLKLKPSLAPYKAAVFPLLKNKPELVKKAKEIYNVLRKEFNIAFDDRGNIGKRYYSQDEIGTPYCITIDFDTLKDDTVTVRDRDTMKQERVKIPDLIKKISEFL